MTKSILKFIKPYWIFAILAPLCMVGEVFVDLLQPKLMSVIVDDGVLGGNQQLILQTGIRMLLLVILGGGFGIASAGFASACSQNFGNDLRGASFRRVMGFSLGQSDQFTTGSLVTRLTNDVTAVQNLVAMGLRMFVRAPMNFVGGIIMTLTLDLKFSTVILLSLPLQLAAVVLIIKKANPLFAQVQSRLDKVNSVVQENLLGARVIKAYVREDHEVERFDKANSALMDTTLKVQKFMAFLGPLLMIFMNAVVIAIIYIGGIEIDAGSSLKVGSVMAAITYVTQILMSFMMMSMMFQMISRANASAARITEVLQTESDILPGGQKSEAAGSAEIAFENVSFTYEGLSGAPVLSQVSFRIRAGEKIAVLGSTGAGKTTLINLIPRFYDVSSGSVKVDGTDVRECDLDSLRGRISVVLQKTELFSGSIYDNILWGREDAGEEEVYAAAQIAQADDFIRGFQQGYQTVLGEKGASLSGGQKQRISIARAILKKPDILIFDDSTSALDLGTEARLTEALNRRLKDTTVIKIAQRIQSVRNFDRILVLDNGSVAGIGTHDELLEHCEVYRDICSSQERKDMQHEH